MRFPRWLRWLTWMECHVILCDTCGEREAVERGMCGQCYDNAAEMEYENVHTFR